MKGSGNLVYKGKNSNFANYANSQQQREQEKTLDHKNTIEETLHQEKTVENTTPTMDLPTKENMNDEEPSIAEERAHTANSKHNPSQYLDEKHASKLAKETITDNGEDHKDNNEILIVDEQSPETKAIEVSTKDKMSEVIVGSFHSNTLHSGAQTEMPKSASTSTTANTIATGKSKSKSKFGSIFQRKNKMKDTKAEKATPQRSDTIMQTAQAVETQPIQLTTEGNLFGGTVGTLMELTMNTVDERKIRKSLQRSHHKSFELTPQQIRKLCVKLLGLFLLFIALGLILSFLANDYSNRDYVVWGEFFIDGILTAIVAAVFLTKLIKYEEKANQQVRYTYLHLVTALLLIFSPLLSVGLNVAFEDANGGRNYYAYAGVKMLVLLMNSVVYGLYLLHKKIQHREIYERQRSSKFFYTNVYREFLAELSSVKVDLSQRMHSRHSSIDKNDRHQSPLSVRMNSPQGRPTPTPTESPTRKELTAKEKYLNVASPKVCYALHFVQILLVLQFMFTMAFYQIIENDLLNSQNKEKIFAIVLVYPIIIYIFKKIMKKVEHWAKTKVVDDYIEFMSLGLAAIPYRKIFFWVTEYDQAFIIFILKFVYKLLFYVLFAFFLKDYLNFKHKWFASFAQCKSSIKKFFKRCFRRKTHRSPLRAPSMKSASRKSIFEFIETPKTPLFTLKATTAQKFMLKFLILEFFDIANIFYSVLMMVMLRDVGSYYETFTDNMVKRYVKMAAIDLSFEIVTVVIVLNIWRLNKDFNHIGWTDVANQYLRRSKWPLLALSCCILFTSSFWTIYYGTPVNDLVK